MSPKELLINVYFTFFKGLGFKNNFPGVVGAEIREFPIERQFDDVKL